MRLWVGLTDFDWFNFHLLRNHVDGINFWRPSSNPTFKALQPGDLFLFKLHSPRNYIVGGGFFTRFLRTPLSLAWRTFGEANGSDSLQALRERISNYRPTPIKPAEDPAIGCILLGEPFYFAQDEWIPSPQDFSPNIVQGKGYEFESATGQALWGKVQERLQMRAGTNLNIGPAMNTLINAPRFGTPVTVTPRLGQGAFRLLVTEAYTRRCSMTRERTLPVLEAAHIHPYHLGGEHSLTNGLLLRSDLHRLFDLGYVTVEPEKQVIRVSRRIKEEFENGRDYYALEGKSILVPPNRESWPSTEHFKWHNDHRFRG